jgi:hypothetical protein
MTFSHKTSSIVFHFNKFLSGKDFIQKRYYLLRCTNHLVKDFRQILTQNLWKGTLYSILSLQRKIYITERLLTSTQSLLEVFIITKYKQREIWRLAYKALMKKGLRQKSIEISFV